MFYYKNTPLFSYYTNYSLFIFFIHLFIYNINTTVVIFFSHIFYRSEVKFQIETNFKQVYKKNCSFYILFQSHNMQLEYSLSTQVHSHKYYTQLLSHIIYRVCLSLTKIKTDRHFASQGLNVSMVIAWQAPDAICTHRYRRLTMLYSVYISWFIFHIVIDATLVLKNNN